MDFRFYYIGMLIRDGDSAAVNEYKKLRSDMKEKPSGWKTLGDTIAVNDLQGYFNEFLMMTMSDQKNIEDVNSFVDGLKAHGFFEGSEFPIYVGASNWYIMNEKWPEAFEMSEKALTYSDEPYSSSIAEVLSRLALRLDKKADAVKYARMVLSSPVADTAMQKTARAVIEYVESPVSYKKFQQVILPSLLRDKKPTGEMLEYLNDPTKIVEDLIESGITVDRDLSGIVSEKSKYQTSRDMTKETECVVWTMPEPRYNSECKYILFVPDGDRIRYLVLEKKNSADPTKGRFVVCEIDFSENGTRNHRMYGLELEDDSEFFPFVMLAMKVVQNDVKELTQSYKDFEKLFLPEDAAYNTPSAEEDKFLADIERYAEWYSENNPRVDRDLRQIEIETFDIDSLHVTVWKMWPPEDYTYSKYVAFVPAGDRYRFFTLEKTFNDDSEKNLYMLCETYFTEEGKRSHRNYNITVGDGFDMAQFAEAAAKIVANGYSPRIISSFELKPDSAKDGSVDVDLIFIE
ncbi:MAG: hypothetical protein K2K84_05150 [Muribaculaceae bacterium]|nr:hypothetical protein [Muribaculaceae bacterium]